MKYSSNSTKSRTVAAQCYCILIMKLAKTWLAKSTAFIQFRDLGCGYRQGCECEILEIHTHMDTQICEMPRLDENLTIFAPDSNAHVCVHTRTHLATIIVYIALSNLTDTPTLTHTHTHTHKWHGVDAMPAMIMMSMPK